MTSALEAPAAAPGVAAVSAFIAHFNGLAAVAGTALWPGWSDINAAPCGANLSTWANVSCTNGNVTGLSFTNVDLDGEMLVLMMFAGDLMYQTEIFMMLTLHVGKLYVLQPLCCSLSQL